MAALNSYNKSKGYIPWKISQKKTFFRLVMTHNIALTTYSAWTSIGMFEALRGSVQNPTRSTGLVGMIDSLCRIHGTSGLGNAITYDPNILSRVSEPFSNRSLPEIRLSGVADQRRLCNEGLAFYGRFFDLSKAYEAIDAAIIITKV